MDGLNSNSVFKAGEIVSCVILGGCGVIESNGKFGLIRLHDRYMIDDLCCIIPTFNRKLLDLLSFLRSNKSFLTFTHY